MNANALQLGLALGLLSLASPLLANVNITEPTGGQNISADKALNSTNGAGFTSLGNIVISEGTSADFGSGNNQTLILTLPFGWRFNAGVGTVSFQGSRDITAAAISVTASNLTVTYSVGGTSKSDTLTIGGLQVQPLDGANAPLAGYIVQAYANPGTANIAGIIPDFSTFGLCNTLPGAARALAMHTQPPTTAVAGVLFNPQPEVRVLDQFGNLRELDVTTVVTASRAAGSGTLQGSLTEVAVAGVVSYTDLFHNVLGTMSIQFSASGLTPVISDSVLITPAPASRLVFATQPGSASVGAPFGIQPVIKSQDQFGNDTTFGLPGSKLVTVTLSSGTGPLLGTTTVDIGTNAGNGIAAFTDLQLDAAGANKQLTASASGFTSGVSALFSVSAASFSKLQILVPGETAAPGTPSGKTGTPAAQASGAAFNVTVNAVDATWNLVNTISDLVGITSSDSLATLPSNAALVNGTKTFSVTLNAVGSSTLTASDLGQPSKTPDTSSTITVGGGSPRKLTIQTQPASSAVAGVAFGQQPVVRVEDAGGNLVATDNGRVITASRAAGTGTLQGSVTAVTVNGVATFTNLSYQKAETITLNFAATSLTNAVSDTVVVSPAAASQLAFATQPGGASRSGSLLGTQPVIVTQDPFGNASTSGLPANLNLSLVLSSGSGSLQGTLSYDIGAAAANGNVACSDLVCSAPGGNKQITASATGFSNAVSAAFVVGGLVAAANGQAISADTVGGAYTTLSGPTYYEAISGDAGPGTIILNAPAGFIFDTGGVAPAVVVTRLGGSGANANNINGVASGAAAAITSRTTNQITFTISSASSAGVACSLTWTNVRVRPLAGTPLANGNLTRTGTSTLAAVTLGTSFGSLTEVAGAANRLAFTTQPGSASAGQIFGIQPVLHTRDQFGNDSVTGLPASKMVSVALTSGTGPLQGTTSLDIGTAAGNGVVAFSDLRIDAGLTTKQLTASAAGFSNAVSMLFAVSPGPASRLTIQSQPSASATAGIIFAQQPMVRIEDQFGNLRNFDSGTQVTASRNAGSGVLQGTTTVGSVNGLVTFTDLSHQVAGTLTIDFASGSLTAATSSSITVNPAAANRLTIQTQPSPTANAGTPFAQQPVIRIEDQYGNLRSSDNATVVTAARSAGSGTLQGGTSLVAVGGVVAYTNLSHNVQTNITVQFTSGSLLSATSGTIAVGPAAADRLVFTVQPGVGTAGSVLSSQPVLKTRDPFGNDSVAGLPAQLLVTVALSSGTGPLQGTVTLDIGTAAGNGQINFSDLRIDVSGTNKQLTASAAGLTSAASSFFSIIPGAAHHLAMQTQPAAAAVAGAIFAPQPVVRIEDAFNNLVNESLTVTASAASGSGSLQGATSRTAVNGVATFTNLSYNLAETISLNFSSGSLQPAASSAIVVSPAAANRIAIQVQPSPNAIAGVLFAQQPVVRIEDQFGNLRSSDNSTVVTASRSGGAGVLQGTTNLSATGGIVNFGNLSHQLATNITIQFASAGLASTTSTSIAVSPAAASKLGLQTQPSASATAGTIFAQQPAVRVEDAFGNLVSSDNSTIVSVARDGGNGTLQGELSLMAVNGLVNFTNLSHQLANTITLQFTSGGLTPVTSANVVVNAGAFTKLHLLVPGESASPATASGKSGAPSAQSAGAAFTVTVQAVDAFFNLVTNATDTVGLTSTDSNASLPANAALVAGTRNFSVTLRTAGEATVTASDLTQPSRTASTSPSITVNTGAFVKLQLLVPGETALPGSASGKSGTPAAQTAGSAFLVTVNAVDANYNLISTITDTIGITSSDAQAILPANAPLASGTGTFAVTLKSAGARTLTVTDLSDGTRTAQTSPAIAVNAAAFTHLQLLVPGESAAPGTASGKTGAPNAQNAGTAFNVIVNAVDPYWNVVNTVNDIVGLSCPDSNATLPANTALVSGTKTLSLTLKTAGSTTLTATDITDGAKAASVSPSITVNSGAFAKLQLLVPGETAAPGTATGKIGTSTPQTAGQSFPVTVQAVDANWNLVNTVTDTVSLSSSDSNAVLPANAALTGGTRVFNVTLKTAGNRTLTASDVSDGTKTASTSPAIVVNAGEFARLQILLPGETAAPGTANGKSGAPTGQTVGAAFSVTVNAVDAVYNPVNTAADLVGITSSDANAELPPDASLIAGTRQFIFTFGTHGSATVTASDLSDNSKLPATSTAVTVGPAPYTAATGGEAISADTVTGPATSLTGPSYAEAASGSIGTGTILLQAPAGFVFDTAGTAPTMLITRIGGSGSSANNINGLSSGTVVPMSSVTSTQLAFNITSGSGSGIRCSLTWQNVQVRPAAGTPLAKGNLRLGGTANLAGVATNSNLGALREIPGAARLLGMQTQPSADAVAGVVFSPQPVVAIFDQFGNARTNDNTTAVTASRGLGSGTLQGTVTRSALNGLVSYTNLSHNIATNITLVFSGAGLTNASSSVITISPAAATVLSFVTQPGNAAAGSPFATQPVVRSQDTFGNPSTLGLPANLNVTVALSSGTGPLQGAASADLGTAAGNGLAVYSGLRIDAAGPNKQLSATAAGLGAANSSTFSVTAGPAARLTIQTQPSASATAGVAFAQQPVVRVEDNFGNLRTTDNSTLVSAARGLGSGTLQGAVSVAANGGLVSFGNLSYAVAELIDLNFSSPGLLPANSATVNVNAAAASKLAILTQPSGSATAGMPFPQQPQVRIEDAYGNLVSSDNSSVVMAARGLGTGTLEGTTTATASGGIASFADLSYPIAESITLVLSRAGLSSTTSTAVAVSAGPFTKLQILVPGEIAAPGTISGKTGSPQVQFPDVPFNVLVNAVDTHWNLVNTVTDLVGVSSSDPNAVLPADAALIGGTRQFLVSLSTGGTNTLTVNDLSDPSKSPAVSGDIPVNARHTAATGGAAISADTVGGSFTLLNGPTYTESASAEAGVGTIILNAPAGFMFDTGSSPTVRIDRVGGSGINSRNINGVASGTSVAMTSMNATQLTFTVSSASSSGVSCRLTWQNVRVRPTAGTPLAMNKITRNGTSIMAGIVNGVSNFGLLREVAGAAAQLGMHTSPSSTAIAGETFAQQPVVSILDRFGNVRNLANGAADNSTLVTATRAAGSGALQGGLTATAVNGLASFANLSHTVATNITILFTSGAVSNVTSPTITVGPATADQLVFTTQPANGVSGGPLGTQPIVRSRDAFGNDSAVGLGTSKLVSLNLSGAGSLLGTTILDIGSGAGNGIALFTDVGVIGVGANHQLTASAAGLTDALSSSFTVSGSYQTINFGPLTDKTYGDAPFALNATASSGLPVSFSILSGPATISGDTLTIIGAGTVTVRASQSGDANWGPATPIDRSFLAAKAMLTVRANDQTRAYGATNPPLTSVCNGFVNGDSESMLSGAPALSTTATPNSPVNEYPIAVSQGTLNGQNYDFTFVNGTLSITPGQLIVTAADASRPYGQANPSFTGTLSGVQNGDAITATFSSTATANSPAGTYDIVPNLDDPNNKLSNYDLSSTDGTLTITKVVLTVTAENKTRQYGAANPAFTATYSGFANGETLASSGVSGSPAFTTTATLASSVSGGPYSITPELGSLSSDNYNFAFADGLLTITAANSSLDLTASANPSATGSNVTFTAVVAGVAPSEIVPGGTVQFRAGGQPLGAPVMLLSGQAAVSTASLAHGYHTIRAEFAGDENMAGSTNEFVQLVNSMPQANLATFSRSNDVWIRIAISNLLDNYTSDADGDVRTLLSVGSGTNGASIVISGGWIYYLPSEVATNRNTTDHLQYTVTDGFAGGEISNYIRLDVIDPNPSGPCTLTGISSVANGMRITFSGRPNTTYQIERATALTANTDWQNAGSALTDGSGHGEFIDGSAPAGQGFYRTARP